MIVRLVSTLIHSWILLGVTATTATGFAIQVPSVPQRLASLIALPVALDVRGGGGGGGGDSISLDPLSIQDDGAAAGASVSSDSSLDSLVGDSTSDTDSVSLAGSIPPMTFILSSLARFYSAQIQHAPIRTKSITAGIIFGLSDYLAQRLENRSTSDSSADKKEKKSLDLTRLWTSVGVGFFYFGPAAHYWYEMIFRILPGTGLFSTLQKAALGQLVFGPSFTCIFFAASLWQAGKFTFANWGTKIRDDLPGAWVAGLGFWPLVDLISFSLVPKDYIPLFVNACSLVWTIYLSLVANR
jgi:Mpv17 / PMP22 family